MDFSLSDEERAVRDTARDFLRKEVMPLEPEVLRRERRHQPGLAAGELVELQQKAKAFGFWGLSTPEENGGMNLPAVMQALIRKIQMPLGCANCVDGVVGRHAVIGFMPADVFGP